MFGEGFGNAGRNTIDEVSNINNYLSPKRLRHVHVEERSTNHFQHMSIFPLNQIFGVYGHKHGCIMP